MYIDCNQNEHNDNAKFGFKVSVAIYDINWINYRAFSDFNHILIAFFNFQNKKVQMEKPSLYVA